MGLVERWLLPSKIWQCLVGEWFEDRIYEAEIGVVVQRKAATGMRKRLPREIKDPYLGSLPDWTKLALIYIHNPAWEAGEHTYMCTCTWRVEWNGLSVLFLLENVLASKCSWNHTVGRFLTCGAALLLLWHRESVSVTAAAGAAGLAVIEVAANVLQAKVFACLILH